MAATGVYTYNDHLISLNTSSEALVEAVVNVSSMINATNDAATTTTLEDYYRVDTLSYVLPRITAVISLFAVVCVACETTADLLQARKQRKAIINSHSGRVRSVNNSVTVSTVTRIQMFYQIPLFCQALSFALGTTPAPANMDIWGAAGSIATCEVQGFMAQFGLVGFIGWDAALSTAYLLMVRYNMHSDRLRSLEKYCHILIWPSALALSIFALVKDMYNLNHSICWLESVPNECVGDECKRGAGAKMMQTVMSGSVVLHLLYSIAIMLTIYCSIRGMEDRKRDYRSSLSTAKAPEFEASEDFSSGQGMQEATPASSTASAPTMATDRRYSRAVAVQGMLYASGMILTTLPTAASIIIFNINGWYSEAFGSFATSVTPLIGYVNFFVFIRGRKIKDCKTSYGRFMRRLHTYCFDYRIACKCECLWCLPTDVGWEEDMARTNPETRRTGDRSADRRVRPKPPPLPTIDEGQQSQPLAMPQGTPSDANGKFWSWLFGGRSNKSSASSQQMDTAPTEKPNKCFGGIFIGSHCSSAASEREYAMTPGYVTPSEKPNRYFGGIWVGSHCSSAASEREYQYRSSDMSPCEPVGVHSAVENCSSAEDLDGSDDGGDRSTPAKPRQQTDVSDVSFSSFSETGDQATPSSDAPKPSASPPSIPAIEAEDEALVHYNPASEVPPSEKFGVARDVPHLKMDPSESMPGSSARRHSRGSEMADCDT